MSAQVPDPERPTVVAGGYMDRSIADFQRACETWILREQESEFSDNALIALLCDAVRCSRELAACAANYAKVDPPQAWKPIDSAPKDGTAILVVEPKNDQQLRCAFWQDHWKMWLSVPGRIHVRPTHWMPLPAPPKGPNQ